jgi:hypothetical protein
MPSPLPVPCHHCQVGHCCQASGTVVQNRMFQTVHPVRRPTAQTLQRRAEVHSPPITTHLSPPPPLHTTHQPHTHTHPSTHTPHHSSQPLNTHSLTTQVAFLPGPTAQNPAGGFAEGVTNPPTLKPTGIPTGEPTAGPTHENQCKLCEHHSCQGEGSKCSQCIQCSIPGEWAPSAASAFSVQCSSSK